jgi:chromosome segregation ATPase
MARERNPRIFAKNACVFALALVTAAGSWTAWAQQDDRRAREVARRMQQMQQSQQQLTQEKTQLEQEKAKLEKENADKDKQIKQLLAKLKRIEAGTKQSEEDAKQKSAEVDHLKADLATMSLRFVEQREKADKLADNLNASVESIKIREAETATLNVQTREQREIVGRQSRLIQACEEKNIALYQLGTELLQRYRNKGVMDALKQAEPFTQLEKVKMENLMLEYSEKMDAKKIDKPVLAQ